MTTRRMLPPSSATRCVLHAGFNLDAGDTLAAVLWLAAACGCASPELRAPASALEDTEPGVAGGPGARPVVAFGTTASDPRSGVPLTPELQEGQGAHRHVRPALDAPPVSAVRDGSLEPRASVSPGVQSTDAPKLCSHAIGPPGVVFLSAHEDGKVYALVDANGDHRVERVHVVASGLEAPGGLAYRDGALFVAESRRLLRIDGIDARLAAPSPPVTITDSVVERSPHGWRYVRFGAGQWLYIPIGARCPVCLPEDAMLSTVSGIKPGGAELESWCGVSGDLAPVPLDWRPRRPAATCRSG